MSPRCATPGGWPRRTTSRLRERLDGLAAREEATDLAGLHERLDGLARHDDLVTLAGRDEVDALRERLDSFARHEDLSGLAGRDEVTALRELLQGSAGRDELTGLRERLESVVTRAEVQTLADRIAQVDRGAGTVLSDVRGCAATSRSRAGRPPRRRPRRSAPGRPRSRPPKPRTPRVSEAARAAEDVAAARRDIEAHGSRTQLLNEHVTAARTDARPPLAPPPRAWTRGSRRSTSGPRP